MGRSTKHIRWTYYSLSLHLKHAHYANTVKLDEEDNMDWKYYNDITVTGSTDWYQNGFIGISNIVMHTGKYHWYWDVKIYTLLYFLLLAFHQRWFITEK